MPEALKLFETGPGPHGGPDDTTIDLEIIKEVFGEVEELDPEPTERVNPFALVFRTPYIVASDADIYNGSAQRVPPCGDQSPARIGLNGPKFLLADDDPTPPLM